MCNENQETFIEVDDTCGKYYKIPISRIKEFQKIIRYGQNGCDPLSVLDAADEIFASFAQYLI